MCNCTNIICYVSPCDTGIDIGLKSSMAGDYLFILGFNGTFQRFTLTMLSTHEIILPNCVNENYIHTLDIYKPDGSLLGNYCLEVREVTGNGNGLTPSPSGKNWAIVIASVNGNTLTDPFLLTNTISEIVTNNQAYLVGADFTQTGNLITGIDISFYTGQILKLIV